MRAVVLMWALMLPWAAGANERMQGLLQMLDYIAVDYPEAVEAGEVVNAAEYAEMQEFAAAIGREVWQLGSEGELSELTALARQLSMQVEAKAEPTAIAEISAQMRDRLMSRSSLALIPARPPELSAAKQIFARQCASCHGAAGQGDGPMGAGLEPAPTDFSEPQRAGMRSIFGLYNTISLGVEGTAMVPFRDLTEAERWSLAFYVSGFAASPAEIARGEALWRQLDAAEAAAYDLTLVSTRSPADLLAAKGEEGRAILGYLRSAPEQLMADRSPLAYSRQMLAASLASYREGDAEQAYREAIDAYLEGFELVEAALEGRDAELRESIEVEMMAWREALRGQLPIAELESRYQRLDGQLQAAEERLQSASSGDASAFTAAFVILLREGLEAILVIAALAAFLNKTGRRDAMRYLHIGWIGALMAGALTWWAATYLWTISGAARELTEAVAALLAAAVLLYVGVWMHSKTHADQWQRFIQQHVDRALSSTTLWSMAGLAFITVYREAFETILFYQALWAQNGPTGQGLVLSGFMAAAAALALLAWFILRYSQRLPLRQFFAVSGVLVFLLAVVFAGKGMAALQEAGVVAMSRVNVPTIEWLGIYPNLEGLGLQLAILSLVGGALLYPRCRCARAALQ